MTATMVTVELTLEVHTKWFAGDESCKPWTSKTGKNKENWVRDQGETMLWRSPSTTTTAGCRFLLVTVVWGHPSDRSVQTKKACVFSVDRGDRERERESKYNIL